MNQRKQLFCCIFDSICMNKICTYPSVRKEFLRWVMMGVGRLVCSTSLKQFFPVLVAWIFGYVWLLSSLPGRSINSYRISVLQCTDHGDMVLVVFADSKRAFKKCPLFYGKSAICRWLRGQIAYAKHVYGSLLLGLHPQTSISNLPSSDTNESRAIQRKRAAREARTQHYSKPSTNCWNVHEFLGLYNVIYIYPLP